MQDGYSQGGWEPTPQGPGALVSHNLHKGVLAKRIPARGKKDEHEQGL